LFAWSAALGKILTMNNLKKRHVIVVDRCCLCKRNGESMDHFLLHCNVASTLWNSLFTRFGMSCVMPRRWWNSRRPRIAAIWKTVPICIFWCVWKERNLKCFENVESSMENILTSFFHTLYLWTVAFLSSLLLSFIDFLVRFSLPS
jgi:hypothetical protein